MYEGRNKARRQQQQIYVNQIILTVTLAPPKKIVPREAIQRNTTNLRETTKSDGDVGINKERLAQGEQSRRQHDKNVV